MLSVPQPPVWSDLRASPALHSPAAKQTMGMRERSFHFLSKQCTLLL